MRLTREIRASLLDRAEEDARPSNSWGGWPTARGLCPYVKLRATVEGEPDPTTGYLCDIRQIDQALRDVLFEKTPSTDRPVLASVEVLIHSIWASVPGKLPATLSVRSLEMWTTPFARYRVNKESESMVHLTQQFEFSAAHRLHCPKLSDEENRSLFGKCNNPSGHGHNYVVEVTVAGQPDPKTGEIISLHRLEKIVEDRLIRVMDHKHLNEDLPAFAEVNPTVENITREAWQLLEGHFAPARLTNVRVYETPKTWADYSG